MSTVVGNCIPLERLKKSTSDPEATNRQLVAVLLTMLDENEEVRAWASDAMSNVDSPAREWAAQLSELTRHVNAPVAGWACKLLGRMGADATSFQSSLAAALTKHESKSVQQSAALALKSIPNWSQETMAAIQMAASDTDPRLSRLANEAMAAQNPV